MLRFHPFRSWIPCPDFCKGVSSKGISLPESLRTKLFHSEAKERLRVKPVRRQLWACGRPTTRTFQAMKYGSCFDTLVIAWMFTLLVAVGFMVHKV